MHRSLRMHTTAAVLAGATAFIPATARTATISNIFGDNMVLQREVAVPVWGNADPGETITVKIGAAAVSARTDAQGKWLVRLPAMKTNTKAQELIVSGRNTLTIKNVLVGDLWLCAGQSNMGVGFKRREPPLDPGVMNLPEIRYLGIPNMAAVKPLEDAPPLAWTVSSDKTVPNYPSVPWYFGQLIHQQTGIPIGIIKANWGGATAENWMSADSMQEVRELGALYGNFAYKLKLYDDNLSKNTKLLADWLRAAEDAKAKGLDVPPIPGVDLNPVYAPPNNTGFFCMYNGMISYLTKLPVKGVTWYQGESSADDGPIYYHKMVALINGWRKAWNQPEMPFYFVQLPNVYGASAMPDNSPKGWPLLREAQAKCLSIPNTGMAVTIDIGDDELHPRNKYDTGRRLAAIALAKTYGKDVEYTGPVYKKCEIKGGKVILGFEQLGKGLMIGKKIGTDPTVEDKDGSLQEFVIAGADHKYYGADAVIDNYTVVVSSDKVAAPASVRYAFTLNPAKRNLYGKNGLPVAPFRTDNW